MQLVKTLPPEEIYEVLSMAEEKGIKLPTVVDEWWIKETILNQQQLDSKRRQT